MAGIEMALIRIEMGISDDQMSQTASVGIHSYTGGYARGYTGEYTRGGMQDQGRV